MKHRLLFRHCTLPIVLLLLPGLDVCGTTNPVGGGLLQAGLSGDYFNNTSLSGPALFTRRDIRIDFDWGTLRKPGGGLSWTKEGSLAADGYSIRWQGQFRPRFSETYTFSAYADSVRVWIKESTAPAYPANPQIDYWPVSDPANYTAQTCALALTAGTAYDLKIEYREQTGPAMMRLLWSSPSTPVEIIQPTAFVGETPLERSVYLADALYGATNWGESSPNNDGSLQRAADGWPSENFNFLIRPQDEGLNPGTYLLRFKGQARVYVHLTNNETFYSADGLTYFGTEKSATQGYDAPTNTTTCRMVIPAGSGNCWPTFLDTDRDGPGTEYAINSGVSDLVLMRPSTYNSTEPHGFDEFIAREAINLLETFVTLRWNDVNGDGDVEWANRKPLKSSSLSVSYTNENHELKILLNNRLGRDLYIQVPGRASDDYILKMAQLIRYGSDENGQPYTSDQANPYHPPLNPNLRVNLEYSNEAPWNTAGQYPQSNWMRNEPERLRQAWLADPESSDGRRFAILNYDQTLCADCATTNVSGFNAGKRFFALRTKEISDIFRSVFGDEAMPAPGRLDPCIRPVLMYQYDNSNNTAKDALFFLDNFFNKTDPASTYSGPAHPVSYYLYGGGAATYYASADRLGIEVQHPLTAAGQGTFQTPSVADGLAVIAPVGSPWTFTGTAGIFGQAARAAATLVNIGATTTTVDAQNLRGFKFTVGPQDVAIYEVGRYVHSGDNDTHNFYIFAAADHSRQLSMNLTLPGQSTGDFAYVRTGAVNFLASNKFFSYPIILQAGQSYYFVTTETTGGDRYSTAAEITPPPGIAIDGTVTGSYINNVWATGEVGVIPNRTFGPVNFKVATQPIQTAGAGYVLGFVQDSKDGTDKQARSTEQSVFSTQAAFLAGPGTAELEITFPAPGYYGLVYSLAHKRDQQPYDTTTVTFTNNLDLFLVDGANVMRITPRDQTNIRPGTGPSSHEGYWAKPTQGYDFFGSAPFQITDAGRSYKIRFAGSNASTANVVMIDNVSLASTAAMTAGEIPSGGGFAQGAPDVSNWEARVMSMYKYAQTFGLKAMSYEGGWYPGGDANKMPLQYYAAFYDEAVREGELNAVNAMARAGLATATDYTREFALPNDGIDNAGDFMRIQAWRAANDQLAAEPTNGLPLLSTLADSSKWWENLNSAGTLQPGGWMSWNVIAPLSAAYIFQTETTAGGQLELVLDEAVTLISGPSGGVAQNLTGTFVTKGLHTLRVKASGGAFTVLGVSGSLPGQPFGLAGLTAYGGNGYLAARWPAVAGAEGYNLYYKARTESTWTKANADPILFAGVDYAVHGLTNEVTHNVVVTYLLGGIESGYSNQTSAFTSASTPLLAWEFDDTSGKTTVPATTRDLYQQGSTLGLTGYTATTNGTYSEDAFATASNVSATLDPGSHFSFTATPATHTTMSLTRLDFGVFSGLPNPPDGYTVTLRWSRDGFASFGEASLSPSSFITDYPSFSDSSGIPLTADLSGFAELQNLAGPVEFRFYLHGATASGKGLGKLGDLNNDVALHGTAGPAAALAISNASLPAGNVDTPYSVQFGSNAIGDQYWRVASGALPPGLTLSATGLLAGTPSAQGTHPFTIRLDDASRGLVTKDFSIAIGPPINYPPQITRVDPAGESTALFLTEVLNLAMSVADEGLIQPLTYSWNWISGPGTVQFSQPNAASTSASFSATGDYLLRFSAFDGENTSTADVSVTVNVPWPDLAVTRAGQTVGLGSIDSVAGALAGQPLVVTYALVNVGDATLTLGTAAFDNPVNSSANVLTSPMESVPPGGSTLLTIAVTPGWAGEWSCQVILPTNDPDATSAVWTIAGRAGAVASLATPLYWGGGTANRTGPLALPTTAEGLTGNWNAAVQNWAADPAGATYGTWADGAHAQLGYYTNGATATLTMGDNLALSGLTGNLNSISSGFNYLFNVTAASPTTLTAMGDALTVNAVSQDGTRGLGLGTNVSLSGGAPMVKTGSGRFNLTAGSNAYNGTVTVQQGVVELGSSGSLNGVTQFELRGRITVPTAGAYGGNEFSGADLRINAASNANDKLADNAVIHIARGRFDYRPASNSVETIGKILLHAWGSLGSNSGTAGGILTLSDGVSGLDRGPEGLGMLNVSVLASGLPNLATRVPNGLPVNALLPWATSNRAEFMKVDGGNQNALTPVASVQPPNDLSAWVAGSDYRLGNNTAWGSPVNTLGNLSVNSLGFFNSTACTLAIQAASTLTIASGGIAFQTAVSGNNQVLTGGRITSGTDRLYINSGDSNASQNLVFESEITGPISVLKGGMGTVQMAGTVSNTYTGTTYVIGGPLTLNKTGGAIAVPGDLVVMHGASAGMSSANQIASTANITIRDRSLLSSQTQTYGGLVTIEGGTFLFQNHYPIFNGAGTGLAFNGGFLIQSSSSPGTLNLQTDVSYSVASASQARFEKYSSGAFNIELDGAARTFAIADSNVLGAGVPEMVIDTTIVDGSGPGSLIKTGGGTLQLTGANTYSGGTIISGGLLHVATISAPAQSGLTAATGSSGSGSHTVVFNQPVARSMAVGQTIAGATISASRTVCRILNDYEILTSGANVQGTSTDVAVGAISRSGSLGSGPVALQTGGALLLDPGIVIGNTISFTGGVLAGAGTIDSDLHVPNGGLLNPGAYPGSGTGTLTLGANLTFADGATLAMDLGTVSDKIAFSNLADNLAASGPVTLALSLGVGFDYGASYVIFEKTASPAFAFAFITGYDTSLYSASVTRVADDYILTFSPLTAAPLLFVSRLGMPIVNGGEDSFVGATPGNASLLSYLLSNQGEAGLTLGPLSVLTQINAATVLTLQPGSPVLPTASTNAAVSITPVTGGSWSVTLSLPTNDPWADPFVWSVTGATTSPYLGWMAGLNWQGSDSSPNGDPDRDGLSNFLEYALNTQPLLAGSPAFQCQRVGSELRFSFPRARAELTYLVETSTDLHSWTTAGVTQGSGGVGQTLTATILIPPAPSQRFLRLRIAE